MILIYPILSKYGSLPTDWSMYGFWWQNVGRGWGGVGGGGGGEGSHTPILSPLPAMIAVLRIGPF